MSLSGYVPCPNLKVTCIELAVDFFLCYQNLTFFAILLLSYHLWKAPETCSLWSHNEHLVLHSLIFSGIFIHMKLMDPEFILGTMGARQEYTLDKRQTHHRASYNHTIVQWFTFLGIFLGGEETRARTHNPAANSYHYVSAEGRKCAQLS